MRLLEGTKVILNLAQNRPRSIFTPKASRAERITLVVRLCSRAMRLTSVAGTGPPAKTAFRNSMASGLAVQLSVGIGHRSCRQQ